FMPNGLAGLWLGCAAWRERVGTLRAMPALLAAISAGLLLAAGTVFAVELLQRLFAQDYRALARAAAAQPWPSVHLFGRDWLPGAIETWLVPVALFLAASLLAVIARRMVRTISYAVDPGAVTAKPTERNSA
ncbi:MAG: branched-chain amino acid ABC transporter permease, partial [Comamonas sp.]